MHLIVMHFRSTFPICAFKNFAEFFDQTALRSLQLFKEKFAGAPN